MTYFSLSGTYTLNFSVPLNQDFPVLLNTMYYILILSHTVQQCATPLRSLSKPYHLVSAGTCDYILSADVVYHKLLHTTTTVY